MYTATIAGSRYVFPDLKTLLAIVAVYMLVLGGCRAS